MNVKTGKSEVERDACAVLCAPGYQSTNQQTTPNIQPFGNDGVTDVLMLYLARRNSEITGLLPLTCVQEIGARAKRVPETD